MQNKNHKKMKKQEMKVFTMYEGWDAQKEKQNRSALVEKTMFAGMEKSTEFHEKREACIRKKYNADEIGQRILNGDGGNWIKEPYDPEVIFQLDRYHIYQEILRKISDKKAQQDIRDLLEAEKPDEMLAYIQIYATSVESADEKDTRSRKAKELYGWTDIYHTDAENRRDIKRGKGTKERWKGKFLCGRSQCPYAVAGSNADGIKKSI